MNETLDRLGYKGPGLDEPFHAYDFIKAQTLENGEVAVRGDGHAQIETLKTWTVMMNEIGVTEIAVQYQDEEYFQ
ncbi:hypothetical protein AZI11_13145 (plasmid) [Levilactobacillus brevis]|uniref:hypothetical protein n=1 Tax=Levilactobacillus brevis TaxID=1580 RepID=UPI000A209433|nr:hypothetical protein [Levilactobacillus brevis]ARN93881.1 hypothetical protein AZI11_13145 [Levilactobacillus brevis]ARN96418.1 hypothetical protein AZI12_13020 [Levilactobacillus brevis]